MDSDRIVYLKEQMSIYQSYIAPLAKEISDEIVRLFKDGSSIPEIAEAFGYQSQTVKRKLTDAGIDWRNAPEPARYELKLIY